MMKMLLWSGVVVWLLLNAVTFAVYGWDKRCARCARRRVPESVLLWMAFLGGSMGALLAVYGFRHKTAHPRFTVLLPLFVTLHAALAVLLVGRILRLF